MSSDAYSAKFRANEKQKSRESDAIALASGRKNREQLRKENSAFDISRVRVRHDLAKRSIFGLKSIYNALSNSERKKNND